ncbi:MAG: tail fiber domain-containing protein, partial [Planctomycetota bacterium]
DSTRVAQEGLTVTAFAHGTTTPAIATDTTDSSGEWDFTLTTPGRYDVQIVDGSETFAIVARDKFQVTELTTRNPTTALPALSAYSTTSEASSLVATFGFRPSTEASGVETPDTPSDNDEGYINFTLSNDNATPQQWDAARITWIGTDVSDGTEDADLEFETMVAGSLATALKIGVSGATGSIIKDEDNMVSDSAVHLATQQSIKAYVDAQVGTVNSLAEVLALGNSTGGTNLVVTAGDVITVDTINETTAASGVTIDSVLLKDGGFTTAGDSFVGNGNGLVVGHTAQIATGGVTSETQILGTGANDSSLLLGAWSTTDSTAASLTFAKSANATIGSYTTVADNETLGTIFWRASDSTDIASQAASISAQIDGTPGNNDVPGRLIFSTASDGAASATEAFRIDSSQNISMRTESEFFIGPAAASGNFTNGNMTVGLTINQEANDDAIFDLKSSDIDHSYVATYETDTFFGIRKNNATFGGVNLDAMAEDDADAAIFALNSFGGTADTTKSTAGRGLMEMFISEHDGAGTLTNVGADGNILAIRGRAGGATTTRYLFDIEGSAHADVEWTTFSDGRLKNNQRELGYGLAEVMQLQPKMYERDSGSFIDGELTFEGRSITQAGFVAQEVEAVMPEFVKAPADEESFYSMDTGRLVTVAIKAIQELNDKVDAITEGK